MKHVDVIERLQRIRQFYRDTIEDYTAVEAVDMAISALEKQGWHNARKDPPKRPDGMWDIYCVYTRFDRCGIAKYYAHGKWDGYDEDGDQIGEHEIIAYCNFHEPYTEEKA